MLSDVAVHIVSTIQEQHISVWLQNSVYTASISDRLNPRHASALNRRQSMYPTCVLQDAEHSKCHKFAMVVQSYNSHGVTCGTVTASFAYCVVLASLFNRA